MVVVVVAVVELEVDVEVVEVVLVEGTVSQLPAALTVSMMRVIPPVKTYNSPIVDSSVSRLMGAIAMMFPAIEVPCLVLRSFRQRSRCYKVQRH